MKVDVVLLAGALNQGPLRECSQTNYEALIKIKGIPMVQYVAQAALQASSVEKIAVVGPIDELKAILDDKIDFYVQSQENIVANIKAGIRALDSERKVLLLTSDIPLISGETIDQFVYRCQSRQAQFYYPIVSKEANKTKFPGTKRTYAHLREGTYTGGNLFVLDPGILDQASDFIDEILKLRKKPFRLSKLLGFKFIFNFLIRTLTIEELEKRLNELTGCSATTLIFEYPEIGFDVDKPSDLTMMQNIMKQIN